MSVVAWAVVVWAQSGAPLAMVSVMRETGALLAGAIGFVVVEEPFSAARLLTTLIAVIGVAALHLG